MVPLASAQKFRKSFIRLHQILFLRKLVALSSPQNGATHGTNQYDSFAGVSADQGMYEFPDYILLTTIVGCELIEIDVR